MTRKRLFTVLASAAVTVATTGASAPPDTGYCEPEVLCVTTCTPIALQQVCLEAADYECIYIGAECYEPPEGDPVCVAIGDPTAICHYSI